MTWTAKTRGPFGRRELEHGADGVVGGGAVDQDVDALARRPGCGRPMPVSPLRRRRRWPARWPRRRYDGCLRPDSTFEQVETGDPGSFGGDAPRDGGADPASRAGDDGDASAQGRAQRHDDASMILAERVSVMFSFCYVRWRSLVYTLIPCFL